MKIGVALSGCDPGGISACAVLEKLEEKGYEIALISSCCMPSVTAMMHACGFKRDEIHKPASDFLTSAAVDTDEAVEAAAGIFPPGILEKNKYFAINSINVPDRRIITFTNAFSLDTEALKTFPLSGARDALGATLCLPAGLGGYEYGGCRLSDYSVWYGCPLYPLKMSGISKNVSISFLPSSPKTPYEALVKQVIAQSSKKADVHVPIEFGEGLQGFDDYAESAVAQTEGLINKIYWRTLF